MSANGETDAWQALRRFTRARIALGRVGSGLPTASWLEFNLAHAQARDAVHESLDTAALKTQLAEHGWTSIEVSSAAPDRAHYLRRPDSGRRLSDASRERLMDMDSHEKGFDVVFVIADGLSAFAGTRHAIELLSLLRPRMKDWAIGPVVIATQARVALGDEIGALLRATLIVMLIGERPGLSSPDSLGIYFTYAPKPGRSDADRNCISNVRPEGLSYAAAAHKLHVLLSEARRIKLTGVGLKDESDALPSDTASTLVGPSD
jgi:ethanolamine ammonia-lyase small subunit